VAIGITFITLVQNLSAAIFVAIAQSVFQNGLVHNFAEIGGGNRSAGFLRSGAADLLTALPATERSVAVRAASDALVQTFYVALAVACTTVVGAVGVRWQSMKRPEPVPGGSENSVATASLEADASISEKNDPARA
jgi:hypothetical protein